MSFQDPGIRTLILSSVAQDTLFQSIRARKAMCGYFTGTIKSQWDDCVVLSAVFVMLGGEHYEGSVRIGLTQRG